MGRWGEFLFAASGVLLIVLLGRGHLYLWILVFAILITWLG